MEDLLQLMKPVELPPSADQVGSALRHAKWIAKMREENKHIIEDIDAGWKAWENSKCETNIDRPVATTTDMGPGDEPEVATGKAILPCSKL